MLLLTSTSDVIRVVTASAAAVDAHASWVDNASGTITPGRTNTANINSATTTTVVGSPGASTQRNVKHLALSNDHASTSTLVTVEHYDGTTAETLWRGTLLAGERVILDDRGIWTLYGVDGAAKPSAAKLDAKLYVTADSVHATAATLAAITGLSQAVKSGKRYCFEAHLFHISNATTTGAQFAVGGVAMSEMIAGSISVVTNSVTAAAMSSGVATAVDTVVVAQTTGAAANAPTILSGSFVPSADGTFSIKATSEVTVASGLTVKKGSWVRIWEVDS